MRTRELKRLDGHRRGVFVWCTVALLLTVSGCAAAKRHADAEGGISPVSMTYTIPVTIESRFREDLNVYVVHDGLSSRVARAGSVTTSRFVIPSHMVGSLGEIILVAEGIGGRDGSSRTSSGRLRVLPGQGVRWTIETRLTNSFAEIVAATVIRPDST